MLAFAWCWRRGREGLALAVLALGILAQSVAVGGDFFTLYRFLLPVLVFAQLLAFSGAERAGGRLAWAGFAAYFAGASLLDHESILAGRYEPAWGMAWHFWNGTPALAALFMVPFFSANKGELSIPRLYRVMVFLTFSVAFWRLGQLPRPDADLISACGFLKSGVGTDAKVATDTVGLAAYISRRPVIDLLGKTDPRIARTPAREGGNVGHNKFDFDYSYGELKPDYVLQWSKEQVDLIVKNPLRWSQAPPGSYPGYHAASSLHPYFLGRCHPNPVWVTASWVVYQCRDPEP